MSPGRSCCTPGLGRNKHHLAPDTRKKQDPEPRQQRGSGNSNPGIALSSAPAQPRSPKPRKHMSDSTTSRCARRLGSQSADRARGAPWIALSASRRPPSSARSSPSSSSISLQPGTEQEAKAGRQQQRQRSHDHARSRDGRATPRRAHVNGCSLGGGTPFLLPFCSANGVKIRAGVGVGDRVLISI